MRRLSVDIGDEIAALANLSREELAALWQRAHGSAVPKGTRHDLLIRSAAWQLQAKRFGGLSPNTRRALTAAIKEVERGLMARSSRYPKLAAEDDPGCADKPVATLHSRRLSPGARLIRDWNGKSHVIDVIENGFVFQAKVYKSLTAIAHQITGAHWSGPRFFGL
jgi:hypothetical protein